MQRLTLAFDQGRVSCPELDHYADIFSLEYIGVEANVLLAAQNTHAMNVEYPMPATLELEVERGDSSARETFFLTEFWINKTEKGKVLPFAVYEFARRAPTAQLKVEH